MTATEHRLISEIIALREQVRELQKDRLRFKHKYEQTAQLLGEIMDAAGQLMDKTPLEQQLADCRKEADKLRDWW